MKMYKSVEEQVFPLHVKAFGKGGTEIALRSMIKILLQTGPKNEKLPLYTIQLIHDLLRTLKNYMYRYENNDPEVHACYVKIVDRFDAWVRKQLSMREQRT